MKNAGSTQKILIVDDDPDYCRWIGDYLGAHNHPVIATMTIADALKTLGTEQVGLIVLDVLFGERFERAGIQMAQELRRHEAWRSIPILFVSVLAPGEVLRELNERRVAVDQDSVRIIQKPFALPDLLDGVQQLLACARTKARSKEEHA
ncbi:MAG: response regulator [Planctomycetes bacterium]|nr:response regulator [Planctomycetota bacterium]